MAVELEEGVPEPVPVAVALEVKVVPVAVLVELVPLPLVGIKVGKVVGAEVVETIEDMLLDETEAELWELLVETLLLLLLPELELELEVEPAPLEAMWNGYEYWNVVGSESRLIFNP
jgi:hypothetical protein